MQQQNDPLSDDALLRRYVGGGSHEAFATLVERYADLVWSSALRQSHGDPHAAEDVAQTVFTALAVKARRMKPGVVLAGWLITATRYAAADLRKAERRRKRHERKAAMRRPDHGTLDAAGPAGAADPDHAWARVAPVLDEALAQLSESLRLAVVLRFFQRKSMREVAVRLGISEDAARQRVCRGLDQLREGLGRRAVGIPATTLSALLTAHALEAAPAGVVKTIASAASVASAAAAKGVAPGIAAWLLPWLKGATAASILLALAGAAGALVLWELSGGPSEETVILAPPAADRAAAPALHPRNGVSITLKPAQGNRPGVLSFSMEAAPSAPATQPTDDR